MPSYFVIIICHVIVASRVHGIWFVHFKVSVKGESREGKGWRRSGSPKTCRRVNSREAVLVIMRKYEEKWMCTLRLCLDVQSARTIIGRLGSPRYWDWYDWVLWVFRVPRKRDNLIDVRLSLNKISGNKGSWGSGLVNGASWKTSSWSWCLESRIVAWAWTSKLSVKVKKSGKVCRFNSRH